MVLPVADIILDGLQGIQPHLLFQRLTANPGPFSTLTPILLFVAGVILLVGHMGAQSEARRSNGKPLDVWVKTGVIFAFMSSSSIWLASSAQSGDALAAQTGLGGPLGVLSRCLLLGDSLPDLDRVIGVPPPAPDAPGVPAQPADTLWGDYQTIISGNGSLLSKAWGLSTAAWRRDFKDAQKAVGYAKAVMKTLQEPLSALNLMSVLGLFFSSMMKKVMAYFAFQLLSLMLGLAGVVCWVMLALRYFVLVTGALLLPAAIACYRTKRLESIGHNYVMHLIGVCLWPVGWAMGHAGTAALYDAWLNVASGVFAWGDAATNNIKWDQITTNWEQAGNAAVLFARPATMAPGFMLLMFVLGGLGVACWIATVTFGTPVLIHKLITTGASFYAAAGAQAGQQAGKAVAAVGDAVGSIGKATGNPALAAAGGAMSGAGSGFASVMQGAGGVDAAAGVGAGAASGYAGGMSQGREATENKQATQTNALLDQIARSLGGPGSGPAP